MGVHLVCGIKFSLFQEHLKPQKKGIFEVRLIHGCDLLVYIDAHGTTGLVVAELYSVENHITNVTDKAVLQSAAECTETPGTSLQPSLHVT